MRTDTEPQGLHWKRKPVPELVRLAWPIAVSMLSYSVMTLTSTLFVGRLGAPALAGVSLGGLAAFALIIFGFGLLRSVKVLVSQATGAQRPDEIPASIGAGLIVATGLGLLAIVLGRLAVGYLPALAATPEAGSSAAVYLSMRNLGAPFALVSIALSESRYGIGDSRSPLWAALGANVTNIALDAVLIFGLGLGVRGAGIAAALGHVVEVALLLRACRTPGIGLAAVRLRHLGELLRLGVPLGLQFTLEIGSFSLLVVMLARIGDADLAAHQIALQLTHLSFLPALAVGEAACVLVGQAVGAGEDGLVRNLARKAVGIAAGYSLACAVVFLAFADVIPAMFTTDPQVRLTTARLLRIAAAFQLFDAGNAVARSVLRGTGDVRYAAIVAVLSAWAATPPLTWLLGFRMGLGAMGGWLGLTVEVVVGCVLLWWRLERGHWKAGAALCRERLGVRAQVQTAEAELPLLIAGPSQILDPVLAELPRRRSDRGSPRRAS
ncbi:MAG: MATE family efflux transporter [Deltaproteobacteria bacterium]|nr:MATE family efflux transporter [Deltaproteobacteria bacterium]